MTIPIAQARRWVAVVGGTGNICYEQDSVLCSELEQKRKFLHYQIVSSLLSLDGALYRVGDKPRFEEHVAHVLEAVDKPRLKVLRT